MGGGGGMNRQRQNFQYIPSNQTSGAPIHYPEKVPGDLKMGNCFYQHFIPGSFLLIPLMKRIRFSRYTKMVLQISKIGHHNNIYSYKTLKILRSYWAYRKLNRIKDDCYDNHCCVGLRCAHSQLYPCCNTNPRTQ